MAKASLTSFNCAFASKGYKITSSYVLGLGGEQVTEYAVSGTTSTWQHTNAFADGRLLASYHDSDTYFALNDWLGTKRVEITPDGQIATFRSLPYGNGLSSTGTAPDATEQHFTGKERDAESGNDYFGARYYSSNMGRWMSPDWSAKEEPVPYAKLDDPQSLNLYAYVRNNPLTRMDPDGHDGEEGEGEGQQDSNVVYKPGVPLASPEVGQMLSCTASCSNQTLRVTSTSEPVKAHPPGTPHADGKAADVTVMPGTENQVTSCAKKCGAQFTQDEVHNPIPGHTTGPHVHLQTVPGKGHRPKTPAPAPKPAPTPAPPTPPAPQPPRPPVPKPTS